MSDARPSKEAEIIRLAGLGVTQRGICTELGVGSHRVSNALKSFKAKGIIPEKLPRGPRKKITKAILSFIDVRTLQDARLTSLQLSVSIRQRFNVLLHPSTIARQKKLMGFHYQPPRHIQDLSEDHLKARLAFCTQMLANPGWLPKIHFSDESRFVLGDDKRWVWYRRGEHNESTMHATQKFPPSVMIFAVIGLGYKSKLLFVEGTIDAEKYIQNLTNLGFIEELDQKHGCLEWIFQQDGAPCHTSQKALDWIEQYCDLLSGWPANSPDLSPIELLWAILKHAVAALRPETVAQLKEVLQEAWDTISQEVIDSLCASFPRRLTLCQEVEGTSISKLLHLCGAATAANQWRADNQVVGPWTAEEDGVIYERFRLHGPRWDVLEHFLPGRTAGAIKHRWYAHLQRREHALLGDTTLMMDIRKRLDEGAPIPEICTGDAETEE
jgi:transposase